MPDILQMARRTAWRKQHHVNAHVVARFEIDMRECFGGSGDAGKAPFVDRFVQSGVARSRFHLDEGDHVPAPGDEVDFTGARTYSACENRPTLEAQPPAGDALTLSSALLGRQSRGNRRPTHTLPFSSIARA